LNILDSLDAPQKSAVAIIRTLIQAYNSADGTGMFSGVERYHNLEQRVKIAAIQSRTMFEFMSRIMRSMQWPAPATKWDEQFISHMESAEETAILTALAQSVQSVIMIARHLENETKAARVYEPSAIPESLFAKEEVTA
jgi:hypothetical protein